MNAMRFNLFQSYHLVSCFGFPSIELVAFCSFKLLLEVLTGSYAVNSRDENWTVWCSIQTVYTFFIQLLILQLSSSPFLNLSILFSVVIGFFLI